MSNSNPIFLILILSLTVTLLLPTALSQPQPIQALLKRLDSKRASPSVQEAAAKAVLKRLLPGCYVPSFQFKIVHHVMSILAVVHTLNALLFALFQLGVLQFLYSCMMYCVFLHMLLLVMMVHVVLVLKDENFA